MVGFLLNNDMFKKLFLENSKIFIGYVQSDTGEPEMKQLASLIKRDCSNFVKNLKAGGAPLYRGDDGIDNDYGFRQLRKRNPRDTPQILHKLINWFLEKKDLPSRSYSTFATPSTGVANGYGARILVIPTDETGYYLLREIPDMYSLLTDNFNSTGVNKLTAIDLPLNLKAFDTISPEELTRFINSRAFDKYGESDQERIEAIIPFLKEKIEDSTVMRDTTKNIPYNNEVMLFSKPNPEQLNGGYYYLNVKISKYEDILMDELMK